MNRIRMGVIGIGGISRGHIAGIKASKDAELVALCDINRETLEKAGILYGISEDMLFDNHADMFRCPDIDAVSICTPNDSHFPIARDAIRAGRPFALEKPTALDTEEVRQLKEAADESGIRHMITFSYRYKTAARFARQLIAEGHLGEIRHIYAQYFQGWALSRELPLIWRFNKAITGSGALGDLGSHLLDLVRFIVGDITKVSAQTGTFIGTRRNQETGFPQKVDVDDYCNVMAAMANGASATLGISRHAIGRGNYQRFEVYGTKGGLVYSLEDADSLDICLGAVSGNAKDYHRIALPENCRSDQMQSFFDILNGRGDGLSATLADGLINQVLLDSILDSAESGRWISV
jgi:predicted dehydrogenase